MRKCSWLDLSPAGCGWQNILLLLTVELTMIWFLYLSRQAICQELRLSSRVNDCGRWLEQILAEGRKLQFCQSTLHCREVFSHKKGRVISAKWFCMGKQKGWAVLNHCANNKIIGNICNGLLFLTLFNLPQASPSWWRGEPRQCFCKSLRDGNRGVGKEKAGQDS